MSNYIDWLRGVGDFCRTHFVPDLHFGVIPGTRGLSLLKPGADLVCGWLELVPRYYTDRTDGAYAVTCQLTKGGNIVYEAVGAASIGEPRMGSKSRAKPGEAPAPLGPADVDHHKLLSMAAKRAFVRAVGGHICFDSLDFEAAPQRQSSVPTGNNFGPPTPPTKQAPTTREATVRPFDERLANLVARSNARWAETHPDLSSRDRVLITEPDAWSAAAAKLVEGGAIGEPGHDQEKADVMDYLSRQDAKRGPKAADDLINALKVYIAQLVQLREDPIGVEAE